MNLSNNVLKHLNEIKSDDDLFSLNEDIGNLQHMLDNPNVGNQPPQKIQDSILAILMGLGSLGRVYPQIRFALRSAIQDYLRSAQ
jgi:hypothetical protein